MINNFGGISFVKYGVNNNRFFMTQEIRIILKILFSILRNTVKPWREITFNKFEGIRNWDSVGFNTKQGLEILFFDILRVIGISGKRSFNRLVNRGCSIRVIGQGKNSGVIGPRGGSQGGETVSNFNRRNKFFFNNLFGGFSQMVIFRSSTCHCDTTEIHR